MTNPLTELITAIIPSVRRAARLAELERAVDETADELKKQAALRRGQNDETRANMSVHTVQDACTTG